MLKYALKNKAALSIHGLQNLIYALLKSFAFLKISSKVLSR